jgi:hypothetical protein
LRDRRNLEYMDDEGWRGGWVVTVSAGHRLHFINQAAIVTMFYSTLDLK